jgi:hypothetical protein
MVYAVSINLVCVESETEVQAKRGGRGRGGGEARVVRTIHTRTFHFSEHS